ncbi:hypothetical protein [Xylanimonas ulmi]|uniref:Lipoprotein n=1 Tax=Xylanimonas ulmi TaxID=228973 RepID=A0A4Q7M2S2_9MICO|nr:hypothetical protein [Xylanibacterium ulmi]RZS60902.1 hypothetical protein EV386_1182 [Xylanibacterium ulmi]
MVRRTITTLTTLVGALAAALAVAGGCAATGPGEACVDWVTFDTPAAAAQGHLVVRGDVVGPAGSTTAFGVRAQRWELDVQAVLAGDGAEPGERITVTSTPVTCDGSGERYPGGDPLDTDQTVVVILQRSPADASVGEPGGLRTVTPFDGVVPPAADGGLPDAWPAGHRP